jgi:hypothetical protein
VWKKNPGHRYQYFMRGTQNSTTEEERDVGVTISSNQGCGSGTIRYVSDPNPDPVLDPVTLVSASRELRGKFALYS